MIHVNARAIIVRQINGQPEVIIQMRNKVGEPVVYELPGGRIEEYESITDALRREVREETGLLITGIQNESNQIITNPDTTEGTFSIQCIQPFASYQTLKGPVDSFGVYFICTVEGVPVAIGDDSSNPHWATIAEVRQMIAQNKFSDIDKPAILMFLNEVNGENS